MSASQAQPSAPAGAAQVVVSMDTLVRHFRLLLPDLVAVISEISSTDSAGSVAGAISASASSGPANSGLTSAGSSSLATTQSGGSATTASSSVKQAIESFKSRWTQLYSSVEQLPGIDWSQSQQEEVLRTLQQRLAKKRCAKSRPPSSPILVA